ncbi:MAG: RNA methyltransferase [Verrucomicrobiales bacterium]|nr:RNA methyltransferase [Verrucomicrobiales bacterium]
METFVVEGRLAVEALLDSPFEIVEVCLEQGRHSELLARFDQDQVPYRVLKKDELSQDRGYQFRRGVFAIAARSQPELLHPDASRVAIPVDLADPGNLGTIIRSAAAFGADGVVVEQGKGADPFNAKCIRASATAVFRMPVYEVDSLVTEIESLKERGFVVFGTSLSDSAVSIREVEPAKRSVVLLGSEESGLPPEIEACCDELVRVPMIDGMDSLNVGASAAIAFWELWG